ncbi:helix-turn-helix domain-containing protein [Phnomibacter ginsenosidimutans]|nr:helix-turn-helix transcriptional regulator [Phnomibacter ginsenosidimutans]
MRKSIRIPRILKIEAVKGHTVQVMFNNGESRLLDFKQLFKQWRVKTGSPEYVLLDPVAFKKVKLRNGTLSWANAGITIPDENGKPLKVPYEIGPDVLYQASTPTTNVPLPGLGALIRNERIKAGITQGALAQRSGTSRFYISRLENNKTDVELATLRKIVEAGLGKKIKVEIE